MKPKKTKGRGALAWFFLPDPGADGVLSFMEIGGHIFARLFLFLSMCAAGGGVGFAFIGPMVADYASTEPGALRSIIGGTAGLIGFFAGAGCSFLVAYGASYVEQARRDGQYRLMASRLMGTAFAFVIVFGAMTLLLTELKNAQWEVIREARLKDATAERRVEAMRDTSVLRDELADARAAQERAQQRYDEAQAWKASALACPSGAVCEDVKSIQRFLGVRDDGIVRGVGSCETCGETMAALNAHLDETKAELEAAENTRAIASAALNDQLGLERSGEVATVLADATAEAATHSLVKPFRDFARNSYRLRGDPREHDEAAIDLAAENAMTITSLIVAFIIDVLSIVFNSLGGNKSTRIYRAGEGPYALEDRSDEPDGPLDDGEQVRVRGGDPAEARVHKHAPRQPFETPDYLAEARRRLREGRAGLYSDHLQSRVDALNERMAQIEDAEMLTDLEKEVTRRETELRRRGVDLPAHESVEETHTIRRSSADRAAVAAESPQSDEMEALRRAVAKATQAAQEAAERAERAHSAAERAQAERDQLSAERDASHAEAEALRKQAALDASAAAREAKAGDSRQEVHVHVSPGDAPRRYLRTQREASESLDDAIARARKMANEADCPVEIGGDFVVWADGYYLDLRKPGARNNQRFIDFQAYKRDKRAFGEEV